MREHALSKGTGLPVNGFGHKRHLPCPPRYTWDWRAAVRRPIAARSCSRKPPL